MSNMSYCRFRNTLSDLRDCTESMNDPLSDDEEMARKALVRLCKEISDDYNEEDEKS